MAGIRDASKLGRCREKRRWHLFPGRTFRFVALRDRQSPLKLPVTRPLKQDCVSLWTGAHKAKEGVNVKAQPLVYRYHTQGLDLCFVFIGNFFSPGHECVVTLGKYITLMRELNLRVFWRLFALVWEWPRDQEKNFTFRYNLYTILFSAESLGHKEQILTGSCKLLFILKD